MKFKTGMALAIAMACAACSTATGGSGEPLTYDQCLDLLEKGAELQGAPVAAMGELLDLAAEECEQKGRIRKSHYDCGMAANSVDQLFACKIPTT